jgi:indolepyruvate ferredoxin oxidoreductase, alpha subunit
LLSGPEALSRALAAARVRNAWSFPGSPLTRAELLLDEQAGAVQHRFTVNEHVAAGLALGGALLTGHNTCALMKHVGISVALDTLGTFGLINELRSAALFVEGTDAEPKTSQNAQDNRGALADLAQLPQLEAASTDELYHQARLGVQASLRLHMPVLLRLGARALDAHGDVHELPPELPHPQVRFSRASGPYVCTAATYRYHVAKRARRLAQLEACLDALCVQTGGEGVQAVVLAGHLGARAQARATARRLPTLRLGSAWPLPRRKLIDFLRGREQVLVLEEGEPFLERELALLVQREGLTCRVRGAGEQRPQRFDDDRLDTVLTRFGGHVRAEVDAPPRDLSAWRAALDALPSGSGDDGGEPWPLHFARLRDKLPVFAPHDRRVTLLKALRELDRPTLIASDPGNTGVFGIRDRLVDVKMNMGSAAPIAGALADAAEVEERPGAPLAVALIGDTNHYHSELNGVLDNAIARRDVLHVLVVNRASEMTGGARTPALTDDALEAQLRAAGLHVATTTLADAGLAQAVADAASRSGPRALVCYGDAAPAASDSDG